MRDRHTACDTATTPAKRRRSGKSRSATARCRIPVQQIHLSLQAANADQHGAVCATGSPGKLRRIVNRLRITPSTNVGTKQKQYPCERGRRRSCQKHRNSGKACNLCSTKPRTRVLRMCRGSSANARTSWRAGTHSCLGVREFPQESPEMDAFHQAISGPLSDCCVALSSRGATATPARWLTGSRFAAS